MVTNITNKPTMAFRFVGVSSTVLCFVEVNARGKRLRSGPIRVGDAVMWAPGVYARLSTLWAAYRSAEALCTTLWAARPVQAGVDNYAKQVGERDYTSPASLA